MPILLKLCPGGIGITMKRDAPLSRPETRLIGVVPGSLRPFRPPRAFRPTLTPRRVVGDRYAATERAQPFWLSRQSDLSNFRRFRAVVSPLRADVKCSGPTPAWT